MHLHWCAHYRIRSTGTDACDCGLATRQDLYDCRRQLADSQALCRELAGSLKYALEKDGMTYGLRRDRARLLALCARVLEGEK